MLHRLHTLILKSAPGLLGAALFAAGCFSVSCKRAQTPDWGAGEKSPPEPLPQVESSREVAAPAAPADYSSSSELRFMAYNLKNWLTMERAQKGGQLQEIPKPEKEKQAIVTLITRHKPDILGVCEIGNRQDLEDLQTRLKTAGLNLSHIIHVGGRDPLRHLALLSRFPIIATSQPTLSEYQLEGKTLGMSRSILDATLNANGKHYRFIGIHLKSHLEVEGTDQEPMRLNEAKLVRAHIDSILKNNPAARLILYGDFNDTRATNTFKVLTGDYNAPDSLIAVPARDTRNESWTHFWAPHETYSRIDFVTISKPLRQETNFKKSYLVEDENWNEGSDHRPIVVVFQ